MSARLPEIPPPTSEAVSRSMQGNRGKDTKPEIELRRLLREAGYPGYRLHWKTPHGRPDIAYPGRKIAIFVNGCFWHRCPHCKPSMPKSHQDYWAAKFAANQERDARKTAGLEADGWVVATVWECELAKTPGSALEAIIAVLKVSKRSRG